MHPRKDQEMNNFISLLDTTLKLNKENDKSDDDKAADGDVENDVEVVDIEEERTLTPASVIPCNNRTYVVERHVDQVDMLDSGDVVTHEERWQTPAVGIGATPVNILDPNVPLPARTRGFLPS